MTNKEAVIWLMNLRADIGKFEHRALWHYEQALVEIENLFRMSKDDKTLVERLMEESEWHDPTCNELLKEAAVRIEDMPSVQPERKKGEWIDMLDFEQCSVCGCTHLKEFQSYYGKTLWVKSKFCPGCGAELRSEENDNA